jgi:hypothetical protein
MKSLKFIGILLLIICSLNSISQEVKNIRVSQSGNRINVMFDLSGTGKATKIDLLYSTDNGLTWNGPLRNLSGEISNIASPAKDRNIVWDALTEIGEIKGNIQFKITTDFIKSKENQPRVANPDFFKHKTMKNIWLVSALVTGGTGIFAMTKGNSLYDDYQTAEENAADIQKKIKTYDVIYPIAFGIAAVSTVNFIIQANKQGKAKKTLSFHPMYFPEGGGAALTLKF